MDLSHQSDPEFFRVTTVNGNNLSVSCLGAQFTLNLNHIPILIPVVRGDRKSIMTHVCSPNFGKELNTNYGLKQHGNLRNSLLNVVKTDHSITVTHDINDALGKYPAGVKVKLEFALTDNKFSLKLMHTNTGSESAPVNSGIHCYFNAPKSYKDTKVNGIDISKLVETTGSVNLKSINEIDIPDMPKLILNQKGFTKAVTWVYQNPEGIFDPNYVCIEPVEHLPTQFGKPETQLLPGETKSAAFSIQISSF